MQTKHRIFANDTKNVGQSTLQRSNIVITENNGTSQIVITPQYKAVTGVPTDWTSANWGATDKSKMAFAESLALPQLIKDAVVSYR